MSILFMTRQLQAFSQLWMERMIEMLADHVAMIAAVSPEVRSWRGRIPTLDLSPGPTVPRRLAAKLGLAAYRDGGERGRRALQRVLASAAIDRMLVHFAGFALAYEQVLRQCGKPVFVHCHGYDVSFDLRHHEDAQRPFHPADYRDRVVELSRHATLIANSNTLAQRLYEAGVPAERVRVKYLGVPVPAQEVGHPEPTDGITILYLGRLVDCKGPDLLIQAFEIACARGLRGRLVIGGDGPLRVTCELLRARSPVRDRIAMLGPVPWDQGDELRRQAHVFAAHNVRGPVTLQEEALGISFLEAMAASLPVISARNGSLPEIIDHGRTGLLVAPGDVEEQARALVELERDGELRRRLGRAAWIEAGDRFSLEQERIHLARIMGLADATVPDAADPSPRSLTSCSR